MEALPARVAQKICLCVVKRLTMIVLMLSLGSVMSSLILFHNIGLMKNNSWGRRLASIAVVDESLWFAASLCVATLTIVSLFVGCSVEPSFDQFVFMAANVITIPKYWVCLSLDTPSAWIVTGCIIFRLFWRFYFVVKSYPMTKAVTPIFWLVFFTYMPFPLLRHCFWSGWE